MSHTCDRISIFYITGKINSIKELRLTQYYRSYHQFCWYFIFELLQIATKSCTHPWPTLHIWEIIFRKFFSRTRKSMTKNKSALVSQSEGLSLWESKRKSTTLGNYNFSYTPYLLHLVLPRGLERRPNSIVWLSFLFEISGIIVKMQNICNLIG